MSKAEERALEVYPIREDFYRNDGIARSQTLDLNMEKRYYFQQGYQQAEKDLALTWEDMRKIIRIDEEMMDDPEAHPEWMEEQPFYEEVLRRFNERKK